MALSSRLEYLKWRDYLNLFFNPASSTKLKIALLETCPGQVIISLEDLCINLNNFVVPLSDDIFKKLKRNFGSIIKKLANTRLSTVSKRDLLKSKKGLKFLSEGLPLVLSELDQLLKNTE